MSICDAKDIPYVDIYPDEIATSRLPVVNMYADQSTFVQMLSDVINASEWKSFTILYESPLWLTYISKLLELNNENKNEIIIRRLELEGRVKDYYPILRLLKLSSHTNILLQTSIELLPEILDQVS